MAWFTWVVSTSRKWWSVVSPYLKKWDIVVWDIWWWTVVSTTSTTFTVTKTSTAILLGVWQSTITVTFTAALPAGSIYMVDLMIIWTNASNLTDTDCKTPIFRNVTINWFQIQIEESESSVQNLRYRVWVKFM